MDKVLVTGASGFLGTHFTRLLSEKGTPWVGTSRSDRRFIQIPELGNQTPWCLALEGCTTVVHLAARVHVMKESHASPESEFLKANRDATRALAEQAAALGVRRLLYLSSIKVNGEKTDRTPFRHDDEPAPVDAYARSKCLAEEALWEVSRETALEVVIIRPPLVYGAGMKGNMLSLARGIRNHLPLPLGALHNRRSLVGVHNLCDLIWTCLWHSQSAGEVFLAGDGRALSTTELVFLMARSMGVRPLLLPIPAAWLRMGARVLGKEQAVNRLIGDLELDISHAQALLGWQPPFSVEQEFLQSFPREGASRQFYS